MKVLVLTENIDINRYSSSIRAIKIIQSLINNDVEVDCFVLDSFEHINEHEKLKLTCLNYSHKKHWLEYIPKIRVLPNFFYGYPWEMKIRIDYWGMFLKKIDYEKYDYVITLGSGGSFSNSFALSKINLPESCKWIIQIHDPYPAHLFPEPYNLKKDIFNTLEAKKFNKVLSKADYVSLPSQRLLEWMSQFFPVIKTKSIIQPHISLTEGELSLINTSNAIGADFILSKDKINIVHTGTLLGPRSPEYFLLALKRLFEENTKYAETINFYIFGKINQKHLRVLDKFPNCVKIVNERIPYLQSLNIQKQADVLLLIEAASDVSPFMPGKLADYLTANKPILALTPDSSETSRILKNSNFICCNGNENLIYEKLKLLIEIIEVNDTDTIIEKQSYDNSADDFIEILNNLGS